MENTGRDYEVKQKIIRGKFFGEQPIVVTYSSALIGCS